MLKKLLIFSTFILASILLLTGFGYVYIKNNDVSQELKSFILNQINQRLDGKLELDDFAIDFLDGKVILEAEDLKLKDKNEKLVCELDQIISRFSPSTLLNLKLNFDSLEASSLDFNLERDLNGEWNINKILKKRKAKKKLISVNYLNIDQININIKDQIQNNQINYKDLQFNLKKEKEKKIFINLSPIEAVNINQNKLKFRKSNHFKWSNKL